MAQTEHAIDDAANPVPVPLPIVVGVTGHREIDPDSIAPVRAAVRDLLAHLRTLFPRSLYVMTALADGADLLVADVAKELAIPIVAALPMGHEFYRTKIGAAYQAGFDRHWHDAALRIELPSVPRSEELTDKDWDEHRYEQLGAFMARRSHVLLALWEGPERAAAGTSAIAPGGTADVLRMRFDVEHALPIYHRSPLFAGSGSLLDAPHAEPVLHIVTPRRHGDAVGTPPAGACFLLHNGSGKARLELSRASDFMGAQTKPVQRGFEQIRLMNDQIEALLRADRQTFMTQLRHLQTDKVSDAHGAPLLRLKCLQAGTDAVALAHQRRIHGHFAARSLRDIPGLAWQSWTGGGPKAFPGVVFLYTVLVPIAVILFEWHSKLGGKWPTLLGYLCVFGLLFALHYIGTKREWQAHFQDYRALAEALRVQLYWAVAGLPVAASDNYLRKQGGELGWIQFALRGPALWATTLALSQKTPDRAAVVDGWMGGQAGYFMGAPEQTAKWVQNEHAAKRNKSMSLGLFALGLSIAFAMLAGDVAREFGGVRSNHFEPFLAWLHANENKLDVIAVTLLAFAATLAVSRNLRAYEAHAHNYKQMGAIFQRARKVADSIPKSGEAGYRADSDAKFQGLVLELGREALSENAEWLMDHRDRAVEPGP